MNGLASIVLNQFDRRGATILLGFETMHSNCNNESEQKVSPSPIYFNLYININM